MAQRISSVNVPTREKQNLVIDDFSGGLNYHASGVDFKDNQAIEYLNAEFTSDKFFSKRRGLEQIKICKNDSFLTSDTYDIEIVALHNPIHSEIDLVSNWKIRPFQYIVIQKTPKDKTGDWKRTRHLMVYDQQNQTYVAARYSAYKSNENTQFKYLHNTWTARYRCVKYLQDPGDDYRNLPREFFKTFPFSYTKSMDYLTYVTDPVYKEVIWEYSKNYTKLTQKDINFLIVDDKLYIKAGSCEFNADKDYYYLEKEDKGLFNNFKQVVGYNTTILEDANVGWNLLHGFVYLVPNVYRAAWKSAIDWGNKNKSLGVISNILSSDIPGAEPISDSHDEVVYTLEGLRSNHPGIMPGGKIFNTAAPTIQDYFEIWCDYIQTPNKHITLSSDPFTGAEFGKKDLFESGLSWGPTQAGYVFERLGYANLGMPNPIEDTFDLPSHLIDPNGPNQPNTCEYHPYSTSNSNSYVPLQNSVNFGVLPIEWLLEGTFRYKFTLPGKDSQTYDFEVKYDKELFDANFVSLGEHQDANVKASEIVALNTNNKLFYFKNYVMFTTRNRLFFTMPGKANWLPHSFSIKLDLEQEDDAIQNVTYVLGTPMIFTKYKIFSITGDSPSIKVGGALFSRKLVHSTKGAIAPESVISLNNRAYHLTASGVNTTFRVEQSGEVLHKPQEIDQVIKNKLKVDIEKDDLAKAIAFKGKYIIYLPSANKFFVKGDARNEKIKDIRWSEWTTSLINDTDKLFYGFGTNRNNEELYFLANGKIYLLSQDQFYDGKPDASDLEKELYECKWVSGLLSAKKPETDKKFSKLKINAFIPGKKGAKVYVKSYIGTKDGFLTSNPNEFEFSNQDGVFDRQEEIISPDIEFNAGSWLDNDARVGISKFGRDQVPVKAVEFTNKLKGAYLTVEVSTKDDVAFIMSYLSVRFRYKKAKYKSLR